MQLGMVILLLYYFSVVGVCAVLAKSIICEMCYYKLSVIQCIYIMIEIQDLEHKLKTLKDRGVYKPSPIVD